MIKYFVEFFKEELTFICPKCGLTNFYVSNDPENIAKEIGFCDGDDEVPGCGFSWFMDDNEMFHTGLDINLSGRDVLEIKTNKG